MEDGYKEYLMQHKFPLCVLHITMDPGKVDVNVHPSTSLSGMDACSTSISLSGMDACPAGFSLFGMDACSEKSESVLAETQSKETVSDTGRERCGEPLHGMEGEAKQLNLFEEKT